VEPAPAKAGKNKARAKDGKEKKDGGASGGCGKTWCVKEDECLAEAWKVVRKDTCIGANQDDDTYWEEVAFDERNTRDPYLNKTQMDRTKAASRIVGTFSNPLATNIMEFKPRSKTMPRAARLSPIT
jgi:hypothetical protein